MTTPAAMVRARANGHLPGPVREFYRGIRMVECQRWSLRSKTYAATCRAKMFFWPHSDSWEGTMTDSRCEGVA